MSGFSPAAVIVHPSGTNNVGYEKEFPLWITGTTGPTFITGTVNVSGTIDVGNVVSASVVNFPAVQTITGTVSLTAQPVSITSTGSLPVSVQAPLPSGSNSLGSIFADLRISGSIVTTSNPVPITGSVAILNQIFVTGSLPVSGTVTVQGTANSGSTALGNPVLMAGVSGSIVRVPAVVDKEPTASLFAMVVRALEVTRPTFIAVYDRISPAANKYMATLFNTSSTKKVVIQRVWVYNWQTAAVNGIILEQEFRLITARTLGTAVTPVPYDSNDVLPAGITADHNTTVVTDSSLIKRNYITSEEQVLAQGRPAPGTSLGDHTQYERKDGTRGLTLRQNQGITFKNITSSTVGTVSYVIEFTVEDA